MLREVPEGWAQLSLVDICNDGLLTDGDWIERKDQDPQGHVRLLQLSDIGDGVFLNKTRRFINEETAERLKVTYLQKEDILLARMPDPLGRCCLLPIDETAVTAVDVCIIRPPRSVDRAWLASSLNAPSTRSLICAQGTGTTRTRISRKSLGEITLSVPPLPEQRQIAKILSSVDEAIAATRAVIEQTRKVKQAVLERLLTKGIGHTRFKQTEIGEIPEGWEVSTLGSITKSLEAGVSVNSESRPPSPDEYGILKTSCVSNNFFDPRETKTVLAAERLRVRVPVKADTIVISRMNTPNLVGANAYVKRDIDNTFLPDRLWQLRTSENARWLSIVLATEKTRARLSEIATGTSGSMKNISKARLLELRFAIPPQDEQEQIAQAFDELDAAERASEGELSKLAVAKSALMSDLLTGRKRVTDALPLAAE